MGQNKLSWLEEVKADARHNYMKRYEQEKTDREYEESKKALSAEPTPVDEKATEQKEKKGK